ncbi:LOW QUALITY PROTEIN: caspase-12 [Papio anubis]|uniref:LOW QUALITY PROTEIN: caspase-12 n=1 Tax=Papio anubis TaxID=9555 RepID=UPI000B7B94E3|nr:LOW QUALITY PROTEIN: caspase-12 [Papio anubis]
MADKKPSKEDPVNMVKLLARNVLEGIFDDLMENNVLNTEELRSLGKGLNFMVNNAGNLVDNITEKAQMAGKILKDRLLSHPKQLSLEYQCESEDQESEESSASSSSSTESEEENEESKDEERAASAHSMAVPPTDISSDEERGPNTPGLIICNKEFHYLLNRNGSELDLLGMQDLLENLGYSVVIEENLTAQEMETALRQFAARPEHQSSDSTFLVFMSHGILNGICGTKHWDQEPDVLHDDTIFEIFNNRNCRSLRDKPKVIIMQACRGSGAGIVWFTTDSGKASADTHGQLLQSSICNDAVTKAHVEKDFIAFKSSTPHNVSWRHEISGSVFISQIIYYFKEYSWSHHLEEIFRKVQRSFETPNVVTQLPTIERLSMTRYFYLFPGN